MTKPIYVLVAHMGHAAPWLQIKTRKEVKDRVAYIKAEKPEREHPLRLKLLKIVKKPLPPKLVKAHAVWVKAYAAWAKAYAARAKAYAARAKAYAARVKAHTALAKTHAARVKAHTAWVKAYAAWEKTDAAWKKADAAWTKAGAAWKKADAAWQISLVSPEGIAFHQQVCGCAWTPEQPDILLQLAAQEDA